uniref:Homeobox-leucine zipper protein HOX22 n=1 Tax=Anthurium amnicola TaxID=1678845 RepID=A0A1D1Y073_9ARAE
MGRPPLGGGPVFRFTTGEVMEMETCLQEHNNALPDRGFIGSLAEKFSASAERAGKIAIQPKQVWNWFQNRRYALRAKMAKVSGKLNVLPSRDDLVRFRNVAPSIPAAPARHSSGNHQMEFEAKSSRDGAWYDVAEFISHRMLETGDPEVCVRFTGFGIEEDEWINVRKCVRQRSLPCEASECVVVLPGDLVLCFQEGKEQALYFDAHVLDAQRRRHDARGCRCRFLVRYDHDLSEEIVPLRKVCRRPETDYRLRILHTTKAQGAIERVPVAKDAYPGDTSTGLNAAPQRAQKQQKVMDVNTEEVIKSPSPKELMPMGMTGLTTVEIKNRAVSETLSNDATLPSISSEIHQEVKIAAV